jgi:hypothetical protein
MKSFKQHVSEEKKGWPSSFENNPQLMKLVKKHDDPLKFLLAVVREMSSGKLKLRIVGAGSSREVAALWNDYNNKKISPTLAEEYLLHEGYERNPLVKELLAKYDDPVQFLLRAITIGGKLDRTGKGNTKELVRVWNASKSKKINAALVESVINESMVLAKGWVNASTGKVIHNASMKPYHVQMIVRNPRNFGLSEKVIKNYLASLHKTTSKEQIEEIVNREWDDMLEGYKDIHRGVEMLAMKKGWFRFVNSNGWVSIGGSLKMSEFHKAAIALDKQLGLFDNAKTTEISLRKSYSGGIARDADLWNVRGSKIITWIKNGGNNPERPTKAAKSTGRLSVPDMRKIGKHPPGSDEWGPIKGRGGKKYAAIYAHKETDMKKFRTFMNEAITDDRKEVAKALKKFAKKYVNGTISVTSGKGKFPYVQLRAKSGKISNELRKMVIDKVMPKANVTNMDDISYGNVSDRIIAIGAGDWKKVMGLKESIE